MLVEFWGVVLASRGSHCVEEYELNNKLNRREEIVIGHQESETPGGGDHSGGGGLEGRTNWTEEV